MQNTTKIMSGSERKAWWNREQKRLGQEAAAVRADAQAELDARQLLAERELRARIGPGLLERDAAVKAFEEQWDAYNRARFADAYAEYDAVVAQARAAFDAACQQAQARVQAFHDEFEAVKIASLQAEKLARYRASPEGQQAEREYQQDMEKFGQKVEQALAWSIEQGRPHELLAYWTHNDCYNRDTPTDRMHPDHPEGRQVRFVAPLRERWLAEHPEDRAMLESPDPDLWDQRFGIARGDRHLWP